MNSLAWHEVSSAVRQSAVWSPQPAETGLVRRPARLTAPKRCGMHCTPQSLRISRRLVAAWHRAPSRRAPVFWAPTMYAKKRGEKIELAARHRSQLIGLTFEDIGRLSEIFAHWADRRLWPDVVAAITSPIASTAAPLPPSLSPAWPSRRRPVRPARCSPKLRSGSASRTRSVPSLGLRRFRRFRG